MKIIISDLHGRVDVFIEAINKIAQLNNVTEQEVLNKVLLIGDLFDRFRGDVYEGIEVMRYFVDNNIQSIIGNHEVYLLNYINKQLYQGLPYWKSLEEMIEVWTTPENGGQITKDIVDEVERTDKGFLRRLNNYVNNFHKYIILDDVKTVISHCAIPTSLDYFVNPFANDVRYYLDRTSLGRILWNDYNIVYKYINDPYIEDPYFPSCLYEYKFITGHWSGLNMIKIMNLTSIDTNCQKTGNLGICILHDNGYQELVYYSQEFGKFCKPLTSQVPFIDKRYYYNIIDKTLERQLENEVIEKDSQIILNKI